jgi:hypothetical protein
MAGKNRVTRNSRLGDPDKAAVVGALAEPWRDDGIR